MKSFRHYLEEQQEHHVSIIPLVGFSPFSHEGHRKDLWETMKKLPGTKHIGISAKSGLYSGQERVNILKKQWGKDINAHSVNGAGQTVQHAFEDVKGKKGKKILHVLLGHDRAKWGHSFKKSVEEHGKKIIEAGGESFSEVHLHFPSDQERSHGMSGTKMRTAAANNDRQTFKDHLGPNFSDKDVDYHFKRVREGLQSGKLKVKR